jgi:hypothetical protein
MYLITKDFCSNVNEPVSGEALFRGYNYFWLINHFKKWEVALAIRNYCGSGDGGCINVVQYTVVAQQMERKGTVSISNFLRFIQIPGYLAILAQHSTVNEQDTDTGLLNVLFCACNCGKLWYSCRQEMQYTVLHVRQ